MANVQVDASALILHGERVSIRDSNDRVYVFVNDNGTIRAYKGNVTGEPTSFAEQTTGTPPVASGGTFIGLSAAIDSVGLVTVICYFDDTAAMSSSDDIRSFGFRTSAHATSQDEWVDKNVLVHDLARQSLNYGNGRLSLVNDGSDIMHAFWLEEISDMGSAWSVVWHSRRTGGSWDTATEVTPVSNNVDYRNLSAMIADPLSSVNADRPILLALDEDSSAIDAYYGNALAATSWVEERDVTGSIVVDPALTRRLSMAIDSNEKITVGFIEDTLDLMIIEHLNANAWTNWETPVDIDTSRNYFTCSLAIDGTDRYLFSTDNGFDVRLWQDTGSGFSEETADADLPNVGLFGNVKVKWSNHDNNSPKELDYVFDGGSGETVIRYNTISKAAAVIIKVEPEQLDLVEGTATAKQVIIVANEILDLPEGTPIVVRALVRLKAEILDLAEGALAHRGRVFEKSEVLEFPEATNPLRFFVKVKDEILDLVEGALSILGIVKVGDEILDLPESPNFVRGRIKVNPEILDLPEGTAFTRALIRLDAEILDLPEAANPLRPLIRVEDEILDLPEDSVAHRGRVFIGDEVLELVEGEIRVLGLVKVDNEILDLVEAEASVLGIVKVDDEVLDLPEARNFAKEVIIVNDEILDLIEGTVFTRALVRLKAEILDLVEATNNVVAKIRVNAEILDIPEGSVPHRARIFLGDEILDLPETANPLRALIRVKDEILDIPEASIAKVTAGAGAIIKIANEILDLVETTIITRALIRLKAEILDLVETPNLVRGRIKVKTETLDLVENSNITRAFIRIASEILNLVETGFAGVSIRIKVIDSRLCITLDPKTNLDVTLDSKGNLGI